MTNERNPQERNPYDRLASFPTDTSTEDILQDIENQGVLPPEVGAQDAVSAVLCVLGQRISGGEADHLLEKLPPSVQAMVQSCLVQAEKPDIFDGIEFVRRVGARLKVDDPLVSASISRSVFMAIKKKLPERNKRDLVEQIPDQILGLWGTAVV
jgi:uncharacterized protein (DUF2267 family)